jgi:hypothetical protein
VAILAVTLVAVGAASAAPTFARSPRTVRRSARAVLRIQRAYLSRPLPSGFTGLSTEYGSVLAYTGTDPNAINPVLVRLIDNLAPRQRFVLRIGGDSTDWTWWPIAGLRPPAGISYRLTPRWLTVVRALTLATDARLILGINLEANSSRIATAEARALTAGIGASNIEALEIGNEPEQYALRWYATAAGVNVPGRPPGYDFRQFAAEFPHVGRLLPRIPLAGPATGTSAWLAPLPGFLSAEPALGQVTIHRYPLNRCVSDPASPAYPTVAHLLAPLAAHSLVNGIAVSAALAHQQGRAFRVDELNSVTCQGRRGVSNTFASALWILDTLFEMARAGVDGVNIHIWPGAEPNELFTFQRRRGAWFGSVRPAYYGLLMFVGAARPGSRLLRTYASGAGQVRTWATLAPDGEIRVVLINDSAAQARAIAVRPPTLAAAATLERLRAPSLNATGDVSLGGRSFGGATATGTLNSAVITMVTPSGGAYRLRLPPASATLLSLAYAGARSSG